MKNIKTHLLFLLLTFNSFFFFAQENTPESISNKFFNTYKTVGVNQAFDYVFSTNNLISKEDVKAIKERVSQYENILGNYYGRELFIKEKVNKMIEVHSYILKYETQPVRFILTFYKPNKEWKIQNFKINDDFVDELESAAIQLGYKRIKE